MCLLQCIIITELANATRLQEHKDAATAWPIAKDGKILHCVKGAGGWSSKNGPLRLSFELARTSEVLYFLSRGIQSTGSIVIVQDDTIRAPDTVRVDVIALHYTPEYLHAIAVCSLERSPGEQGVGIFVRCQCQRDRASIILTQYCIYMQTPRGWSSGKMLPQLDFEITVRLPKISLRQPLQIAALETSMPNFAQHTGDLMSSVHFGSLSLSGTNGDVSASVSRPSTLSLLSLTVGL